MRFLLRLKITRFVIVGIINTILDFALLNLLVFAFDANKLLANSISMSIAMLCSYALNSSFVFNKHNQNHAKNLPLFLAITAFGLFIIQNSVIYVFASIFTLPGELVHSFVELMGAKGMNLDFIVLNTAKIIATAITMIWNFLLYQRLVFKD